MIAPLTKTSVRGVVWYQGESNVNFNTDYYQCHISTMIQDWTNTFLDGHVPMDVLEVAFPFGVAQVNNFFRILKTKFGSLDAKKLSKVRLIFLSRDKI